MGQDGIKIWYQNPVPLLDQFQGLGNLLEQTVKGMGREGTRIELKWLKKGSPDPTFSFTMTYNALSQAHIIHEAESQGYDAAVIGNSLDFGLRETRSVANIPVTGVLESALYVASSLGNTYSIVCIHNKIAQFISNLVRSYGMSDHLARVTDLGISLSEAAAVYDDPERLMALFKESALKTIREDRAEVIIMGCTILSSLLTLNKIHEIEGVPVIDLVWAGIKMAEVMVDLKKSYGIGVCRASIYGACPEEEVNF